MRLLRTFLIGLTLGILPGCSGSSFTKGSTQSAEAPAVAEEAPQNGDQAPMSQDPLSTDTTTADAPSTAPTVLAGDIPALNECLKQWVTNPFTPEEIARPLVININDNVNNNAIIFNDSKVTTKPTLSLVNFNISVGNNGELQFLNPKGWYCFNVKAKVINNFVITAHCDTHVAIVAKQAQNDKNFTIQRQGTCPL